MSAVKTCTGKNNNPRGVSWKEMNEEAKEITASKPYWELLLEGAKEMEEIQAEIEKKHEEIRELHARLAYLAELYT